jgi:transcriptional regulator with XRE-family HTH domain
MNEPPASANPEYRRLVEQETLIADAQELVCELLERVEMSRQELARRLGKTKGYVSQLLSGERNMTLRTLADLAYATGYRVELRTIPLEEPRSYEERHPPLAWAPDGPGSDDEMYGIAFLPALTSIEKQAKPLRATPKRTYVSHMGRQHKHGPSREQPWISAR